MPYHGDSPTEAWEYWFDEPPSEIVQSSLERFAKNHAAAAIIEAIEITSDKAAITTEAVRLRYIKGILDRKLLAAVAPKRAEEERQIARTASSRFTAGRCRSEPGIYAEGSWVDHSEG
jgi:hypothetical protein